LEAARIAIKGGSGFEKLSKNAERLCLETPYGTASPLFLTKLESKNVIFSQGMGQTIRFLPIK
jgi:purine nucleoside phosphorylase